MTIPPPDPSRRKLLAEALELSRYLGKPGASAKPERIKMRQNRLRQIREALRDFAHPICHEAIPIPSIPLGVRRAFVQSVLLVTRYRQVGSGSWQSTLPSPTLSRYRPDPIAPDLLSAEMLTKLCQFFELSAAFERELTETLATIDANIKRRRQIIQAVLAAAGGTVNQSLALHLFQQLFGPLPIPEAAIDFVCTEMQIFFCLPYLSDQWVGKADQVADSQASVWKGLSEAERHTIEFFLRSLGQAGFEQFQRFPSFGPCNPKRIDRDWCDRVAQQSGIAATEILQVLSQSVGLLPTQNAEAFLVHDIWGHHWQLLLTQFHSDYAILTNCNEPLRARETAYTPYGPLSCGEIFQIAGDRVELDSEKAYLFFHGEVQQRLGLLFTHLLAEMIADVAEFKFIFDYPQSANQLPSSSLFKEEPTKLDLGLRDIDNLFLQVLKPLLESQISVFEDSRLETDLLTEWAAAGHSVESLELRTSLKQAAVQLYQIFLQEYNATYLPTLVGEVGIFTQIISNLLYLQNAVNSLYTSDLSAENPALPYRDLLITFIGCYCSSDSYADFWYIDDVLAEYFLPCWRNLSTLIA